MASPSQEEASRFAASFDRFAVDGRLPLPRLIDALRSAAGVRLTEEDARDLEEAARPYAPLTKKHAAHFVAQARGRHEEDVEVISSFAELSGVPSGAAASLSLQQLREHLCSAGDALTDEEWRQYLDTIAKDAKTVRTADVM